MKFRVSWNNLTKDLNLILLDNILPLSLNFSRFFVVNFDQFTTRTRFLCFTTYYISGEFVIVRDWRNELENVFEQKPFIVNWLDLVRGGEISSGCRLGLEEDKCRKDNTGRYNNGSLVLSSIKNELFRVKICRYISSQTSSWTSFARCILTKGN